MVCENYSFTHICPSCQTQFLAPSLYKRKLPNGVEVYSFYKYSEIKELLFTKHTDLGYHIYKILAQNSFLPFAKEFRFERESVSIPIDDHVRNGYSHTALLNHALHSKYICPLYNKLRASNTINYAGKDRAYRLSHPKEFTLNNFEQKSVILVDDIITTGSTLTQAAQLLKEKNKELLFCLTLSDVSLK
jgi:competence protein ComFC